jgi:GDP-fucose protein O-fucosyltransferase
MATITNHVGGGGTRRAAATSKPSLSNHTGTGEALSTVDLNHGAKNLTRGGTASAAASKPLRIGGGALSSSSSSSSSQQPPVLLTTVMVAIAVCCVASIAMSTTHVQYQFGGGGDGSVSSADARLSQQRSIHGDHHSGGGGGSIAAALSDFSGQQNKENTKVDSLLAAPFYPKLQCKAYGGPSEKESQEMVYWQGKCVTVIITTNMGRESRLVARLSHTPWPFCSWCAEIPSDSHYQSPFHVRADQEEQFMTFEPDGGGWNNIRMAMETVVGLAIATGRTLVLPPEQRMYLLQQERGKTKTDFSFVDFFPMHQLEQDGLKMISMEEFLQRQALTGQLKDKTTGLVSFPPEHRINWNGQDVKLLKEWLRNVTLTPHWSPSECLAVFAESRSHADAQRLQQLLHDLKDNPVQEEETAALDQPLPVDATTRERLQESLNGRRHLCLYDQEMQSAPVVHFMCR